MEGLEKFSKVYKEIISESVFMSSEEVQDLKEAGFGEDSSGTQGISYKEASFSKVDENGIKTVLKKIHDPSGHKDFIWEGELQDSEGNVLAKADGESSEEVREILYYWLEDREEEEREEGKDYYDADHAAEWMEKHPHGWYNSEHDKGTGDEDDEE